MSEEREFEYMPGKIKDIELVGEVRNSFLSYAMSVIVQRALPDVRDGLKPVHRRILFGMDQLGVYPNTPYKKSARIVGDVMGKYHPHGDSSIYDAMVRMAQPFSYRYPLVSGHGNFGSIDGDSAAAMRYTEAKMSKITTEMLKDIDKDTIDFMDNYDGTEKEPVVLPSRVPNFLINGATGIAVGMATNVPTHNLSEVVDGYIALIDNPDITTIELMQYIKGPDFPTGGIILGTQGIKDAYETGRGSIKVRGKVSIEEHANGKHSIIISEIPYQVNKSKLIERIADLAKEKKVEGITDIRDESNKGRIKIVIELKRDVNAEVLLNNLYKNTQLQTSFSVNMLALVNNEPKVLTLKECLKIYLNHQLEVLKRKTAFDLDKAKARAHILEGLVIVFANLDEVLNVIRNSYDDVEERLMANFKLSEIQTKQVLAMPLRRLTGLEIEKVRQELVEVNESIVRYEQILGSEDEQLKILKSDILEVKEKYGDERLTEIDPYGDLDIDDEDLIPKEDVVIAITHIGYAKRMTLDEYRAQNRGGRGKTGMKVNADDVIERMITTSTHDFLLFFTSFGRVYKIKGYKIPEASRISKGLPISNVLEFEEGEKLAAILNVSDFENGYLFFVTASGTVKRTEISDFQNIRTTGIRAINLRENDTLINVLLTNGSNDIILAASNGKAIRFNENDARSMGRTAGGVRGMMVEGQDKVIGASIAGSEDQQILVITKKGYGKRTLVDEYRCQTRGGKGVKTLNVTDKNGELSDLLVVDGEEDILVVTNKGMMIRVPVEQIAQTGRATQGVKIINLLDEQEVSTLCLVPHDSEEDELLETQEPNENQTETEEVKAPSEDEVDLF